MNTTTSSIDPTIVTTIYGIASASGLFAYTLFTLCVLGSRDLRSKPFFKLALSLALADIVQLSLLLFYSTPSSIEPTRVKALSNQLGTLLSFCWFSSAPTLFVQSLLLFEILRYPLKRSIFSGRKIWFFILGPWIVALPALATADKCCHLSYYSEFNAWSYGHDEDEVGGGLALSYYDMAYNALLLSIGFSLNLCSFAAIRRSRSSLRALIPLSHVARKRVHATMSLFVHLATLLVYMAVFITVFYIFVWVSFTPATGFISNLLYIANSSLNAYAYLIGNRAVRHEATKIGRKVLRMVKEVVCRLRCPSNAVDNQFDNSIIGLAGGMESTAFVTETFRNSALDVASEAVELSCAIDRAGTSAGAIIIANYQRQLHPSGIAD